MRDRIMKPEPRSERAWSMVVAVILTLAMLLVMVATVPGVYEMFGGELTARQVVAFEQITYVAAPDDTRVRSSFTRAIRGAGRASRPLTGDANAPSVAAPASVVLVPDVPGDPDPGVGLRPAPRSYAAQPVSPSPPGRFPGTRVFTLEQQDSTLYRLSVSVPHHPKLPPTQAQRDSLQREAALRWAMARDQKRPVAVPMDGGGIRVGLLSPGPSREQRRRDSIIHAGNLKRLQVLADRARARRDSVRFMDSIAMLRKP